MAKAVFRDKLVGTVRKIFLADYPITKITDFSFRTRLTDKTFTSSKIASKSYAITKITNEDRFVRLQTDIPFRVKFTTIGIEGYGPNNVPPIGIAVIGYSNYIL